MHEPSECDVCVVGSGAAGGIASYVLSKAGCKVTLLEAGVEIEPAQDYMQHVMPFDLPCRGLKRGGSGDALMAPHLYVGNELDGEPYTLSPDSQFLWIRARCLGGRTNHWGRAVARFSPEDWMPYSVDGIGEDWPLTYDDLLPFYEKVETLIGVYGPESASRMSGPGPRCTDRLVERGCKRLGIPCIPASGAVLTRAFNGRAACHYCGQCGRGCKSASNFSSTQVLIPQALDTGNLYLMTQCMAREIHLDDRNQITHVSYVDKRSRAVREVRCKALILAAGACESARLLLNSSSRNFPRGLANSSGTVGRFLRDSVSTYGVGYFPELESLPPHQHEGVGRHMVIPHWRSRDDQSFTRAYRIEFGGGRHMPSIGEFHHICDVSQTYGQNLKDMCRKSYGTTISFAGFGEMLPDSRNRCEIDPDATDKWGIPVLRFRFQWSDNEKAMARDIQYTIKSLISAMGGQCLTQFNSTGSHPFGLSIGGENGHELGTVRMGKDPRTSVLNGFCQSHDVRNLFVVDGGCFTSSPEKPPTLTIMALAWRASEFLITQKRRYEV